MRLGILLKLQESCKFSSRLKSRRSWSNYIVSFQWHPSISCEENARKFGGRNDSMMLFDNDLIKCCPMCAVPIEKDEGCAQMMCKRCKHVFCWYCLASLDVSADTFVWWLFSIQMLIALLGWLPVASLRQRPLQKQTRTLACICCLASSASHRNICGFWNFAARCIATFTAR